MLTDLSSSFYKRQSPFLCEVHNGVIVWNKKKNNKRGGGELTTARLSQSKNKLFVGGFLAVGLGLCMSRAVTVIQMVFPHVPFIMLCTVVTFGWDCPVYFQLSATSGVCGLKVVTGQWIWLLRAGSKCAAPIAGNERLPWALSVTEEITGHLGLCRFPRSVSEICIWANQAERGGCFPKGGSFT